MITELTRKWLTSTLSLFLSGINRSGPGVLGVFPFIFFPEALSLLPDLLFELGVNLNPNLFGVDVGVFGPL